MQKLMLIDGNSIVNRAFYAIRMLTNKNGQPTNAIYGFLNLLLKYMDEEKPDALCVAFDLKAPTFRHKKFEGYKAQRKGMPDELASQMPVLKELLAAMNVAMVEIEGYEADDILGTLSRLAEESGMDATIVTGDKDAFQLISDHTTVKLPSTRQGLTTTESYDKEALFARYELTPSQIVDLKALMGDSSDNIPGVPGVGEKTALNLLKSFKTLDGVYENLDDASVTKGLRAKLESGRDSAYLSYELATICRTAPVEADFSLYQIKPYNMEKLVPLMQSLELKKLMDRMAVSADAVAMPDASQVDLCSGISFSELQSASEIAKMTLQSPVVYRICYGVKTGEPETVDFLSGNHAWHVILSDGFFAHEIFEALKPIFEDETLEKWGHDIKRDKVALYARGITLRGVTYDTMLAAYLLEPNASQYLPKELAGEAIKMAPSEETFAEVAAIHGLVPYYQEKLRALGMESLYQEIELPLADVLADMEIVGFKVDREQLLKFSIYLDGQIKQLEFEITALAGESFNINSSKQLGVILFEKLGLPVVKKTKTGYSTDADVLEKLKEKHEIIPLLMEYRKLTKLKSTYADGLMAVICQEDQKIHSVFHQTVTATGRISSSEPNLQNIPVRTELGREVRKMFVASDENYVLVDADYSQIELRVLSHIADDKTMQKAFLENQDIHAVTASQVFDVPLNEVTPEMRRRAKAVNFGIVYGISDFGLSEDLGISRKEAKQYIENYLQKYSGIQKYMHDVVEGAKRDGYVTTLFRRRRYIPELQSSNYNIRSFGERAAMNAPIQGTAADIIKIAMVKVHRALKEAGLKSRLVLQVHDELIIEAYKPEVETVKTLLKDCMEQAAALTVPLTVDLHTGESWYDAK